MSSFVFLHVGTDPFVNLMVKSIAISNPGAKIFQCSDSATPKIEGVTDVFRLSSDPSKIMRFRLEIFAKLGLKEPAIYLDTDYLVLNELNATLILNDMDIVCCKRSFNKEAIFNVNFRNMDFSEYKGKTLNHVYPFIACFTVTNSYEFWSSCFENLLSLDKKFQIWYGDQEAIRNVVRSNIYKVGYLPESTIACLPEYIDENISPLAVHFKGASRKELMPLVYEHFLTKSCNFLPK